MKIADLQNLLAANNDEWEVGMKILSKCRNEDNHKFIPHLIGLCVRRNQIAEEMKCAS